MGAAVSVSRLADEEEKTQTRLKEVASNAFPTPQHYLVHFTPHTLVARNGKEIVGGAVLDIVGSEEKIGIVSWLFTAPDAQGQGAGTALVAAALEYFEERNCQAAIAVVQWLNTASSTLFAREDFFRISSTALGRKYGTNGLRVWLKTYHFINVSADLWYRKLPRDGETKSESTPVADQQDEPATSQGFGRTVGGISEVVLVHALLLMIVVGGVDIRSWDWVTLGAGFLAGGLILTRVFTYVAFAARDSDRWTFWRWGNVYPFAGIIAVFGGFLPVPGHLTPGEKDWDYRKAKDVLGPAAATWGVVLLVALLALVGVRGVLDEALVETAGLTLAVLVVLDLWFIVWPLDGYNGRVLYDWKPRLWVALSVATAGVLGLFYVG